MARVIIALGSNTLPAAHMQWAAQRLSSLLAGDVCFSRTLWTQDIHHTGIYYMNRLAAGSTSLPVDRLEQMLKDIEAETERTREAVTLDLDLMLYDGQRYHEKDWPRPYIQQLINEIL